MAREKRKTNQSKGPPSKNNTKKTTKNKLTNKTLVVFTCKKNNRMIEGISSEQKYFWKEKVFTKDNIVEVATTDARNKIRKSANVKTNALSDREKAIGNIIANEIGNNVIVLDWNNIIMKNVNFCH